MIDLEENGRLIQEFKNRINKIYIALNLEKKEEELKNLENKTLENGFWDDINFSNSILKQIKEIKSKIKIYTDINKQISDLQDLNELLRLEADEELEKQLMSLTKNAEKGIEKFEIQTLLSGKYDKNNAIITLHPGAGGTESQDWVEMLYRMYSRWANKNGYTIKELEYLEGDEAGIKSVTALVEGENAYGYLKCEHGVHRLVRISPFDAGGRRHTSFASLEVLPEITDDIEIDINPNAKVEAYRPNEIDGGETNLLNSSFTYVVDAIDTMTNKLKLIEKAKAENINIITATGAGNKLDPTKFEVKDIYNTSVCPVCKILRKELSKRNIKNLKVVYSKETPKKPNNASEEKTLGSISFVPSVAGLIVAGEVIKDIINN